MILTQIAEGWGPFKRALETSLGISSDAMHVLVGMLLLLGFTWITRRPLHDWRPWLMVFSMELVNEFIDLHQRGGSFERNLTVSARDLVMTMFLPTLLLLYHRFRHWRRPDVIGTPAETPAE